MWVWHSKFCSQPYFQIFNLGRRERNFQVYVTIRGNQNNRLVLAMPPFKHPAFPTPKVPPIREFWFCVTFGSKVLAFSPLNSYNIRRMNLFIVKILWLFWGQGKISSIFYWRTFKNINSLLSFKSRLMWFLILDPITLMTRLLFHLKLYFLHLYLLVLLKSISL